MSRLSRRDFVTRSAGIGAGALTLGRLPEEAGVHARRVGTPIVITSHDNATGRQAMVEAWGILGNGGSALDAVERGANVIEVDPEDTSVGYGGLPNENGVVQLDASIMDGKTYSAGSVASIENIKTPSSVARLVMERTDHVMLVGPGALAFAKSFGFPEEDLMTEKSREMWLRWREQHSENDDWGPPDHMRGRRTGGSQDAGASGRFDPYGPMETHHGTTNVLAVDANGDVAGITTTSGMSWKVPGRIGDSPIIGAGLYVDNLVGAAGATGRGEDVIKSCASYFIVMRMRDGRSPQEACEDALHMIAERYRAVGIDYMPGEKFVAINKDGEVGCAQSQTRREPGMTVAQGGSIEVVRGSILYPAG
ncbi:MAG: N(4)-(beta-N-acetylglucosaminyl)-L-asparaginase [Gemmatimonadota bacterium]